jgi:hypothetical protein
MIASARHHVKNYSSIGRKGKAGREARLVCTFLGTINLFGFHVTIPTTVEVLPFHEFVHSNLKTWMVITLDSLHSIRMTFSA